MSFIETLIILVVAMIVFGPKRMPEMARKAGKWMGMLRRASDEFKRQLMTMDQTVGDTLNSATDGLDRLVPSDEELGAAVDYPLGEGVEPDAPAVPYVDPYNQPPSLSPDDAWDAEPVSGGLMPESAPEDPAQQSDPPQEVSVSSSVGPKFASRRGEDGTARRSSPRFEEEPAAPRSLGLSPTRSAAGGKESRRG